MAKRFRIVIQGVEGTAEIESAGFDAAATTVLSDPNRYKLAKATPEGVAAVENISTGKTRFFVMRRGKLNWNWYPISPSSAATVAAIAESRNARS